MAAATPAPGAGSSAGWACALAAALAEMTARISGRPEADRAAELRARALELAEADLESYAPVLAAPPEGRAAALSEAATVPLAIAEAAAEVAELAAGVVAGGRRSVEGDATAGALLAEAVACAAARLVELNLAGQPDDPRLDAARGYARRAGEARARALGAG